MEQRDNSKKRLSNEAMNIVIETSKEVTERMVEKELNYLRENLPKIIADYMFQNKLNIDKEEVEELDADDGYEYYANDEDEDNEEDNEEDQKE